MTLEQKQAFETYLAEHTNACMDVMRATQRRRAAYETLTKFVDVLVIDSQQRIAPRTDDIPEFLRANPI